jgi:hypothetical protein
MKVFTPRPVVPKKAFNCKSSSSLSAESAIGTKAVEGIMTFVVGFLVYGLAGNGGCARLYSDL